MGIKVDSWQQIKRLEAENARIKEESQANLEYVAMMADIEMPNMEEAQNGTQS